MTTGRAAMLFCCFAALPLVGCAGTPVPIAEQSRAPVAAAHLADANAGFAAYRPYEAARSEGSAAPVAVLVFLPGADAAWARSPGLWTAQGFDVVMPRVGEGAAASIGARALLEQARAMADAPIWFVGPSPMIQAALDEMPALGNGAVSGIVETSLAAGGRTCSESVQYSSAGVGAVPKVVVHKSGNACPPGAPHATRSTPAEGQPTVPGAPTAPHLLQAAAHRSAAPYLASRTNPPVGQQIADLIAQSPASRRGSAS